MKDPFSILKGRVEGIKKVTGKATYSAEYDLPNMVYGVLVGSTIASGKLKGLDLELAKSISGVIEIFSYWNKPQLNLSEENEKWEEIASRYKFFHTNDISFQDQPIALVVAETFEEATYAASFVKGDFEETSFNVDFDKAVNKDSLSTIAGERGNYEAWQNLTHIIDEEYTIAREVHNPMEMHATIAHWTSQNTLHLYDKSQNVFGVQGTLSNLFDIPSENVRVTSEFVGGGFGSGLLVWFHTFAAAMAAKALNRPVKVNLTRNEMFTSVGHRPQSWQRVRLGADANGKLVGILHQSIHEQTIQGKHTESITAISQKVYAFQHVRRDSSYAKLNIPRPTWMRGPGDSTGSFGVESALDELSYQLNIDPIQLRLNNIAPYEMDSGKAWSSHYLNECLEKGAKQIGWENRPLKPGQLKEGKWNIGYGMGVGLWNAWRRKSGASLVLTNKGDLIVRTAMTDIGTGTGEAMVNMTHQLTGIPKKQISVELGDTIHPKAPSQGGSWGLSSLSGAVYEACISLKKKILNMAWGNSSDISEEDMILTSNSVQIKNTNKSISYTELLKKSNSDRIEAEAYSEPDENYEKYGFCSSAAHFYKVRVNTLTGKVKLDKMVIVVDAGTIINNQAAANQIIGAAVGGVGMALIEKQEIDSISGRLIGNDFAGYHVPVNGDVPIIDVSFINKPDPYLNPMGSKGLGEVGLIGAAPAISNAIYNAIGKRLRDLPITPEKILMTNKD